MLPTDEKIKKDVSDQIYWDHRINASNVQVSVKNGTVYLEGTVPSFQGKESATTDALSVQGVLQVENNLKILHTPSTMVTADADIQTNIQKFFLWNPNLTNNNFEITVDRGWVTLEGTVDSYWKKALAEAQAQDVVGVLGVTNKITVVPTNSITDERIAEEVVNAIDRDTRVAADDIHVKVTDGRVLLSGTAPNWTAKSAAYSAAKHTYGATDVQDRIIVGPS